MAKIIVKSIFNIITYVPKRLQKNVECFSLLQNLMRMENLHIKINQKFNISEINGPIKLELCMQSVLKNEGIPITGHEGPRGMWMQGSTYSQPRHQKEVEWLVLRSAAFTPGKPPVLILQEAEWTPGPVWTLRSEGRSLPLRHPGQNPGRPASSKRLAG